MGISSIQRKKTIREEIERNGSLSVSKAVKILKVSEVTVRKYFHELERENFLLRTYGGAVARETPFSEKFFFGVKARENIKEKQAIARKAYGLIRENETIFLDTGTTVFELSKLIKSGGMKVVVATNSLSVISELSQNRRIKVFVLGGFLRHELMDFSGTFIKDEISHLSFTQAFLGVDGISAKSGITTTDSITARIEEEIMDKSLSINILADFSKIGRISLIPYGKLENRKVSKTLVTDSHADKNEVSEIGRKLGIKIIQTGEL